MHIFVRDILAVYFLFISRRLGRLRPFAEIGDMASHILVRELYLGLQRVSRRSLGSSCERTICQAERRIWDMGHAKAGRATGTWLGSFSTLTVCLFGFLF